MNFRIKLLSVASLFIIVGMLFTGVSLAASDYPRKPVNLIVPFAPGGGMDISGRAMAEAVKPFFRQPITIVNRAGGGGTVGAAEAVMAKPDGYTIGYVGNIHIALQPHRTRLPYNTPDDYQPFINIFNVMSALGVRTDSPWKTLKELVEYARNNPGKVRVGNAGLGVSAHLATELLNEKAKIKLTPVPFTGDSESVAQLYGGHIEATFNNAASIIAHVRAGKIRILALASAERYHLFKEIPTIRESGYDVVVPMRYLLILPKKTPDPIATLLHDVFKKAIETESFKAFADKSFFEIDYMGPKDIKRALNEDYKLFAELVQKLNLKEY
jgi:tripartite-type tricarboxylate transporter receptor subunit TctC